MNRLERKAQQHIAILDILRDNQFRNPKAKGLTVNVLFEQVRKKVGSIHKTTFLKLLKKEEARGVISISSPKNTNRKYIRSLEVLEGTWYLIERFQNYCGLARDDVEEELQATKGKQIALRKLPAIKILSDVIELFTEVLITKMFTKSKAEAWVFAEILVPRYFAILRAFMTDYALLQKKYISQKALDNWYIKVNAALEKDGDMKPRTDAPNVIQLLDTNLPTGGYIDALRSGDYGHTRIQRES